MSLVLAAALLGLGIFALVHPEYIRGGSLILLGLAVLERGSPRTQRLFTWISRQLAGRPSRRRRQHPGRVRPSPTWQPVA